MQKNSIAAQVPLQGGFRRHVSEPALRGFEATRSVLALERAFRAIRKTLPQAEAVELLDSLRSQLVGGAK